MIKSPLTRTQRFHGLECSFKSYTTYHLSNTDRFFSGVLSKNLFLKPTLYGGTTNVVLPNGMTMITF